MLKVYPDNGMLTQAEKYFNRCLCKMRFVVEHAFGRLKGRWRCLLKRNDTTMQYIIQQTAACCVLHNLCEMQEEEFEEDWRVEQDVDGHNINNPEGDEEDAEDVRDVLKGMLQRQRGL
jgi:hypothetical protein